MVNKYFIPQIEMSGSRKGHPRAFLIFILQIEMSGYPDLNWEPRVPETRILAN